MLRRLMAAVGLTTADPVAAAVGRERSPHWTAFARAWLQQHPACAVCGTRHDVVPHHQKPYHLWPELELVAANLIGLCPPHHLLLGHLMDWRAFSPTVAADAQRLRAQIQARPYARDHEPERRSP